MIVWGMINMWFFFSSIILFFVDYKSAYKNANKYMEIVNIFLQGTFGEIEFGEYESEEESKIYARFGKFFHSIFILMILVIMLNLIIAIITDVYADAIKLKNGLFCNQVLRKFPALQWDNHYGFLTCAIPPFNILVPLVMPVVLYAEYKGKD